MIHPEKRRENRQKLDQPQDNIILTQDAIKRGLKAIADFITDEYGDLSIDYRAEAFNGLHITNPVSIQVIIWDAIKTIDEQQPKWIPVSKRKPKSMANKVIVYVEHEDLVPKIGYGHYEKFQGVEMWYDLETQEQFSKHGYTVTHWMPMPKSLDGKRLILD